MYFITLLHATVLFWASANERMSTLGGWSGLVHSSKRLGDTKPFCGSQPTEKKIDKLPACGFIAKKNQKGMSQHRSRNPLCCWSSSKHIIWYMIQSMFWWSNVSAFKLMFFLVRCNAKDMHNYAHTTSVISSDLTQQPYPQQFSKPQSMLGRPDLQEGGWTAWFWLWFLSEYVGASDPAILPYVWSKPMGHPRYHNKSDVLGQSFTILTEYNLSLHQNVSSSCVVWTGQRICDGTLPMKQKKHLNPKHCIPPRRALRVFLRINSIWTQTSLQQLTVGNVQIWSTLFVHKIQHKYVNKVCLDLWVHWNQTTYTHIHTAMHTCKTMYIGSYR